MKQTIRELQKQGFKKTTIKGLYLTNLGKCYNYSTNRSLTPTVGGKLIFEGKAYNLAKLILETFCKIPVRNGQIVFLDNDKTNFSFQNLEYSTTGTHHEPPTNADLIKCIRFYFQVDKKFTTSNILYKFYLYEIAKHRGFIYLHTESDFSLFLDWLNPTISIESQSKGALSKKHGFRFSNGVNAINKYLDLLVKKCLQDNEIGLLKIKDFTPKPLTKTQRLKAFQLELFNDNWNINVPLRKKRK